MSTDLLKGRGARVNPANRFAQRELTIDEHDAVQDEPYFISSPKTRLFFEQPKNVVNKVTSPDLNMEYSLNPYQGCEHGCVYCYARPTHEYWGFSAGLDFESKIVIKENSPERLEEFLLQPGWRPRPIVLSGNTDCYQPLEKKLEITRSLLQVFKKYRHPVGIITKNALVARDLDILKDLAADKLVSVILSVTTLDEKLRSKLEPRTSTATKKLEAIAALTAAGVPVGTMLAPIIPGLNDHEIPEILRKVRQAGAVSAAYTIVRLNGPVAQVFENWIRREFPLRADKVLKQIMEAHDGSLGDSTFGRRIMGEGRMVESIAQLFQRTKHQYFGDSRLPKLDTTRFRKGGNYTLF